MVTNSFASPRPLEEVVAFILQFSVSRVCKSVGNNKYRLIMPIQFTTSVARRTFKWPSQQACSRHLRWRPGSASKWSMWSAKQRTVLTFLISHVHVFSKRRSCNFIRKPHRSKNNRAQKQTAWLCAGAKGKISDEKCTVSTMMTASPVTRTGVRLWWTWWRARI